VLAVVEMAAVAVVLVDSDVLSMQVVAEQVQNPFLLQLYQLTTLLKLGQVAQVAEIMRRVVLALLLYFLRLPQLAVAEAELLQQVESARVYLVALVAVDLISAVRDLVAQELLIKVS
jgi:hypothetical protein